VCREVSLRGQGPGFRQRHTRYHARPGSAGRAGGHGQAASAGCVEYQRGPAKRRLRVPEALDGPKGQTQA
jgi:hypothetical protein